jgi:uncharacterized protein (DUF1697 family)
VKRVAALLRAVNVGGTGKLPMADLKRLLEGLGLEDPKTLLASGNAVFGAKATNGLEARLEAALADRLGVRTQVLVRDHAELAAVIAANPFAAMARDLPNGLIVMFLKGQPKAGDVAALRSRITGGEAVEAGERCLYIAYGEGMGRSKFTGALIEKALGLSGTGRNFNTVRKLAELTA